MSNPYHTPVLLQACIEYLKIVPGGTYVDLTFGGGGHSRAILEKLGKNGQLFAFDQDEDAKQNAPSDPRFTLIPHNFRYLKNYLRLSGVTEVDGILGDLGVSSHQFDEASRGFSLRFEGPLDMRMNHNASLSAEGVVNNYPEESLRRVLREYGELNNAGRIAHRIVEQREENPLTTTSDLKECLAKFVPRHESHKFYAKVFQALRIEVNQELDALRECLTQSVQMLKTGGRLVMISYHSLEDRLVKHVMKTGNVEGKEVKDQIYGTSEKVFRLLTSRAVVPGAEETETNSRARSAKLRAAEKI
jgi:16S rRNA (cytosine1402-N4)-methyltransferase